MNVSLTYQEINRQLSRLINQEIAVGYCGDRNRVEIIFCKVHLYIKIESLYDNELVLSHQIGRDSKKENIFLSVFRIFAQRTAQKVVNRLLEKFVKIPAVSVNENQSICVKLNGIEQLQAVLEVASLSDINFDDTGINVQISLL